MNTSTKQTQNLAESGNKSKPLLYSVACEYGEKNCKNNAKWHVVNGWGFNKKICTTHKNKMQRNGGYSVCNAL